VSDSIRLQANIGGFGGAGSGAHAVTVLGEMLLDSQILLIDAAVNVRAGAAEKRYEGCAVVTNNAASEDRDALFTEENLRQAVGDYFDFQARGLLSLDGDARQFDPASGIEMDGIDERGRKYRFNSTITNGQVAVLVLCWFAQEQVRSRKSVEAAREYEEIQAMFNIGMVASARPGSRQAVRTYMGVPIGIDGWPV
jgi:hypothetical protein